MSDAAEVWRHENNCLSREGKKCDCGVAAAEAKLPKISTKHKWLTLKAGKLEWCEVCGSIRKPDTNSQGRFYYYPETVLKKARQPAHLIDTQVCLGRFIF